MLGNKDRVVTHRRLPAVIGNIGRSQPTGNEIFGMAANRLHPFFSDIVFIGGKADLFSLANISSFIGLLFNAKSFFDDSLFIKIYQADKKVLDLE